MARVEPASSDSEQLKKEIKKQVVVDIKKQARRKKLFRYGSCLLLILAVVVFAALMSLWALALSGLYDVPVFSDMFFKTPEPIHQVEIKDDIEDIDLLEYLESEINEIVPTGEPGELTITEASVSLDEYVLTAFLWQRLAELPDYKIIHAQIAVEPAGMEIFIHGERGYRPFYLTIMTIPKVADENLELDIISAKLGNLRIPSTLISTVLNTLLANILDILQLPIIGFVSLDEIELLYGKIKLNGLIEYTTFDEL